jgi:glucose/arabinose dehydrogenase
MGSLTASGKSRQVSRHARRIDGARRAAGAASLALLAALLVPAPSPAQTVTDPDLVVSEVLPPFTFDVPTSMAFVGSNDFLVLQKETGIVRRVRNGKLSATIALDVSVNFDSERGLLGIAVNTETPRKVFLFYTEAGSDGGAPLGNRVYRYTWNPNTGLLHSPQLILDLPVTTGPNHDGGVLRIGRSTDGASAGDGAFLYVVIGDLNRNGKLQNISAGADPDDTGVIFRIEQDGTPAPGNPFAPYCSGATATLCDEDSDCGANGPCVLEVASYYAYGVRNSFGMARDPVTDALWMTENGPNNYDEVNRVDAGLNSGWNQLMGPDARDLQGTGNLWNMPNEGLTYSDPEFSWLTTIAPTGIVLPNATSLGRDYDDVVLVGDANLGQLYAFPLNAARTAFDLTGFTGVTDLVADNTTERNQFRIGQGFASITDLVIGPDRHLYVVSIGNETVYRISGPALVPALGPPGLSALALLLVGAAAMALGAFGRRRTPTTGGFR